MATIVVGSYMVRYPLGGMLSWVLQYLVGFDRLGHDVWFVERADHHLACFDPVAGAMGDDPSTGLRLVGDLLSAHGLGRRWCFVDVADTWHGAERASVERAFREAELFVDMGTHGSWLEQAAWARQRVLLDGEPGFTQVRRSQSAAGLSSLVEDYDRWFTVGRNIGTPVCPVPTAGIEWEHIWHPVVPDLFRATAPSADAPFTTVMNWQSHDPIELDGITYGHKDMAFERLESLPRHVDVPLEVAIGGAAPLGRLDRSGWRVRSGHSTTETFRSFAAYLEASAGELGIYKQAFVDLHTGWFSDRSAAYLASGRPVIALDTGFSAHLPTDEGLIAVHDVVSAREAIGRVRAQPDRHRRAARRIAEEVLDARRVLGGFLDQLGIEPAHTGVPR